MSGGWSGLACGRLCLTTEILEGFEWSVVPVTETRHSSGEGWGCGVDHGYFRGAVRGASASYLNLHTDRRAAARGDFVYKQYMDSGEGGDHSCYGCGDSDFLYPPPWASEEF